MPCWRNNGNPGPKKPPKGQNSTDGQRERKDTLGNCFTSKRRRKREVKWLSDSLYVMWPAVLEAGNKLRVSWHPLPANTETAPNQNEFFKNRLCRQISNWQDRFISNYSKWMWLNAFLRSCKHKKTLFFKVRCWVRGFFKVCSPPPPHSLHKQQMKAFDLQAFLDSHVVQNSNSFSSGTISWKDEARTPLKPHS